MSFAFNTHNVFFLLDKTLHLAGRVHVHDDKHYTDFPNAAVAYTPALRNRRLVHISYATDSETNPGTVCVISEGPDAALFSWGCNLHAQQKQIQRRSRRLNTEDSERVYSGHPIRRGREYFSDETPVSSACNASTIMVVTREGGLWYMGKCPIGPPTSNLPNHESFIPTLIPPSLFDGTKIVEIAAGYHHLVAVCKKGFIWAWGNNEHDEVGLETEDKFIVSPIRLDHMLYGGHLMRTVAAGNSHSGAVSVEGICFQWGKRHELVWACVSPPNMTAHHPNANSDYIASRFQNVCCGSSMTLSLDTQGRVWSQGYANNGQLGLGRTQRSAVPQLITGFPLGDIITKISCGYSNSGAITRGGDVYVWGNKYIHPEQRTTMNRLRSLEAYIPFDDTPVCIKKIHKFSPKNELAFLMASVNKLNIGPSALSDMPLELFESILRPYKPT